MKIVVCYGTADGSKATKVPIPFGEQKTHKPLTVANDNARKITALDAEAEEEKYKSTPVTSFEFVTVTL